MSEIKTFAYQKEKFGRIKAYHFGTNWPTVYLLEDGKEIYIGESSNVYNRSRQHYDRQERKRLKKIHIVTDEEFNKSAALDIESWLIQYMSADGQFALQNGNGGLQNHNYFDREKYEAKFEIIWEKLQKLSLVKNDLIQIRNSDLFKYSPYKALSEDQIDVVHDLMASIFEKNSSIQLVHGQPGTGKTILAVYLVKRLLEHSETSHLKVALVVPMTSLRKTIKKVFRNIKGLSSKMVIGPSDVVKDEYDVLLVDESHRLQRRVNLANFASFDAVNKHLELDNTGTQLDWILMNSKHQIFFYDKNQSVRPSDIRIEKILALGATEHRLNSQMRVLGGTEYLHFIDNIFELQQSARPDFENYDFHLYDDIHSMVSDIKKQDKEHSLARVVAGYAWPWKTKNDRTAFDIEIEGLKLRWNSQIHDWVNSPNALNEVGCIHTVQGYDLNYVGVIIGAELSYDKEKKCLIVNKDKYYDVNGKRSISDPEELLRYIINIYKTLLTRGIKGTYVYVVDEGLREYFRKVMQ